RSITYGELGDLLGIHQRPVRLVLWPIQEYCRAEPLPPLTILVVRRGLGTPGTGFIGWEADDLSSRLEEVFRYPWSAVHNPFLFATESNMTTAQLAKRLAAEPSISEEVYRLVRARGVVQI